MGMRFRKSVNLGGARMNLSKSGVGFSVGTKGARVTKKANGGFRSTVSIPGTGVSYVSESGSGKTKSAPSAASSLPDVEIDETQARKIMYWVFWALWLPMVLMSALLCLLSPFWLLGVAIGIAEFTYVHKTRKRRKAITE